MNKGWIKAHRSMREHWIFQDPLLFKIWMDILWSANYEKKKVKIKGKIITINPGQFWTSIRKLSVRWDIDKNTVGKKLKLLQSDGMIFVDSMPNYGTLITVCNYALYQDFSTGGSDKDSDNVSDKLSDKDSDNAQTRLQTNFHHDEEYKEYIRMNKEGKKTNGLPPGHPDYFEEV